MPKAKARSTGSQGSAAVQLFGGFDFATPTKPVLEVDVVNRARAELRQGKPGRALSLARQALNSNPEDSEALNIAGVAAFQSGEREEGLDLLRTAVAFAPGNAEAQTNLGNVLAALDQLREDLEVPGAVDHEALGSVGQTAREQHVGAVGLARARAPSQYRVEVVVGPVPGIQALKGSHRL